jgi:hypothetical protein
VVELSPRPPLAAEKVIDERGVEVRVVSDEKDGSSTGDSMMKGNDAFDRVFLRKSSELPPAIDECVDHERREVRLRCG